MIRFPVLAALALLMPVFGAAASDNKAAESPLDGLYILKDLRFQDTDLVRYLEIGGGTATIGVFREEGDESDCRSPEFCNHFRDVSRSPLKVSADEVTFLDWQPAGDPFGEDGTYETIVLPGTATAAGVHGYKLDGTGLTLRRGGETREYVKTNMTRQGFEEIAKVIQFYDRAEDAGRSNACVLSVLGDPDLPYYVDLFSHFFGLFGPINEGLREMNEYLARKDSNMFDEEYRKLSEKTYQLMDLRAYILAFIFYGDMESYLENFKRKEEKREAYRQAANSGTIPKDKVDALVSFFRRDQVADRHITKMLAPCWKI